MAGREREVKMGERIRERQRKKVGEIRWGERVGM